MAKTSHIQIRVSPAQKAALVRRARAAGLDLSAFVLKKAAPETAARFALLVESLSEKPRDAFVLAEVSDLLQGLKRAEFRSAVEYLPKARLDDVSANLLCAMVDTRAAALGIEPPDWSRGVQPLRRPWFASDLVSMRVHLLCNSPPAFRQRNLFVDSTLGNRV